MKQRTAFRQIMEERRGIVAPGAYDGVSARLIEQAGFEVAYMTGNGVSASRLGLADLGFAGLGEMADNARNLAHAVSIPLVADADTGYGNALNVRRTVQMYEASGVAALHIEDQEMPKRCGLIEGKSVVSVEEFALKIKAAVEARSDPDLMIIARTDAIGVNGFEDALGRAAAAARQGADMLFIVGPRTEDEIATIAREFDLPLLFNYAPSGPMPLSIGDLRELGIALIILPTQALLVAAKAVKGFLEGLRSQPSVTNLEDTALTFAEYNKLVGLEDELALGERYAAQPTG